MALTMSTTALATSKKPPVHNPPSSGNPTQTTNIDTDITNKVHIDFDATVVNDNTFKPVNHVYAGGGDAQSTAKAYADSKAYANGGSAVIGDTSLSNSNDMSNNSNNSSQNNTNVNIQQNQRRIPVSTAYAAPLTASMDTCLGSVTAGGQTQLFGISVGGTKRDKNCELIKLAREAGQMGMADVQCQLLSMDERFAEALRRSGRTCELPVKLEEIQIPDVELEEFDINSVRSLPPLDGPYDGERG